MFDLAPETPPGLNGGPILLTEDNDDGTAIMQRAFREAGIDNPLQVVGNGAEAMDYLRGVGTYANRREHPIPDVLLLDLDLPQKHGFGVVGWIRTQAALKSMIVVILTASNRSADADRAYALGANYYLTKPGRFDELVGLIRCLHDWLSFAECTGPTNGRRNGYPTSYACLDY